jgi:D-glycero-alpha-D-manno-heptose 1-phosphate guanylyltransferase
MVDAIILAGGLGTRLSHIIPGTPKALAPIRGTPFLQILLNQISRCSFISKIIMALGHKAESISSFLQKTPQIDQSIELTPLGTGGAILHALSQTSNETLFILNGDTFFDIDFDDFYEFHKKKRSLATIAVRYEEHASRYGSLQINSDKKIVRFEEKSSEIKKGWVSGGMYLMQKEIFASFCSGSAYSLEHDFIPQFLEKGVFAYCNSGTFIDIGTEESYHQAQQILQPWVSQ